MIRFNKSFKFNQTFGQRSWNSKTEDKINNWVAHIKQYSHKISYSSLDFSKIIPKNPDSTFIYADPPYFQTEAGYNAYWSKDNEIKLADYLINHHESKGTFLVSGVWGEHKDGVENSPLLEKLVKKGFDKVELKYNYEKVGRNKGKTSKEIIIKNY